ncbi:MAG: hypothetical protein ACT4UQ_05465 [Gammaproteobacteria bacterium]
MKPTEPYLHVFVGESEREPALAKAPVAVVNDLIGRAWESNGRRR